MDYLSHAPISSQIHADMDVLQYEHMTDFNLHVIRQAGHA